MDAIKLTGGGEIDLRRGVGRTESGRPTEGNANLQKAGVNSTNKSDSINVSDRAAAIGELTAKVDQLPEVRQEKVERLRSQVQAGSFRPPASEIADALIKDEAKPAGEI